MKKNRLITLLVLGLVIVLAAYLGLQTRNKSTDNDEPQAEQFTAIVNVIKGTPEYRLAQTSDFIPITSGAEVSAGTTIKTGANSQALVIFENNAVLTIAAESEITIKNISIADQTYQTSIEHTTGKIFSQIESVVGTSNEYEVEAGDVIAAVRGTGFGISFDENGDAEFYVTEHKVDLSNKRTGKKFTLREGRRLRVREFLANSNPEADDIDFSFKLKNNTWDNLIQCLVQETKAVNKGEALDLIRNSKELAKPCLEEQERTPARPAPTTTPDPIIIEPIAKPQISNVNLNLYKQGTTHLTCTWNGRNSTSYKVAVGTSPKSANVSGWKTTSEKTYFFSNQDLSNGQNYYCRVQGFAGTGLQSSVVSSKAYYHDNTQASFSDILPVSNDEFYNEVSGDGYYSDMGVGEFQVKFSIKSTAGSYANKYWAPDDTWSDTATWIYLNPVDAGGGMFTFSKYNSNNIPLGEKLEIKYILFSSPYNRIYDTHSTSNLTKSIFLF